MRRLLALLCIASLAFAAPARAAKMALFDDAHAEDAGNADWVIDDNMPTPSPAQGGIGANTAGTFWTGAISSYGVDLVKRGYTVFTNTSTITYGNTGNPYDLANFDVFIVPEPNTLFTAAEKTAILNFVRDGGGLIAISDHAVSDRNNDGYDSPMIWNDLDPTHLLGVHFGVTGDANNNIVQTSTNVATSLSDSITHGPVGTVTGLAFHNGTTMTLYPATNPTVRGEVWTTGTAPGSTTNAMAASSQYGSGRVFFIGDSSPVDDGSARAGNSSIYDGWGEAGATDSTLFLNATLWASRRAATGDATAPTVNLSSPDGGETWKAGSVHAITWSASDNVGVSTVDLAYSTNGGTSFASTIATGLSNTGTYNWTVPNAPGTTVRVRAIARDAAGNMGSDSSAANFTIDRWVLTASAGANGAISPSGAVQVAQGAGQAFTITPDANYHVADVLVDGGSVGAVTGYTFSNVTANHTIAASFAIDTRTLTASAGSGGTIDPVGAVSVAYGGTQAFTITPGANHHVADVLVDGGSVGAVSDYTFTGVTTNHTIAASFAINTSSLTIQVVGDGAITRTPDLASYPLFSTVDLAAAAGSGWAFAGWSGDTATVNDPITLAITGSRTLTATFVDVAPPAIALTAPVGGETWRAGSEQVITWNATDNAGVAAVTLEVSFTGPDGPWTTIDAGVPNTGSYDWQVPGSPLSPSDSPARVRLTAFDAAGNAGRDSSAADFTVQDALAGVAGGPAVLALARPSPNPSGGTALVAFSLPRSGHARLDVIDASGRRVAEMSGDFGPGAHAWRWDGARMDGSRARAGLYFVRLSTPFGSRMQRLVRLD